MKKEYSKLLLHITPAPNVMTASIETEFIPFNNMPIDSSVYDVMQYHTGSPSCYETD